MSTKLNNVKCEPCAHGGQPLSDKEIQDYLQQLKGWQVIDGKKIVKEYKFENFISAQNFVIKIGQMAEQEGHHPDIEFGWGYAKITWYTHAINGLHDNDFICAAKSDFIL